MNRFFAALLFLASCSSCNDTPSPAPGDNNNWVAEPAGFDVSILQQDTALELLYETSKHPVKIEGVLLNDKALAYQQKEGLISAPLYNAGLGKNTLKIAYRGEKGPDTLVKEFIRYKKIRYTVRSRTSHNPAYFTQGLYFDSNGNLVESTGLEGASRILFYRSGKDMYRPADSIMNANHEFGEGTTEWKGKIIQLLWQNRYLKVYDKQSRKLLSELRYTDEGWGICTDGEVIYASNGTGTLNLLNLEGNEVKIAGTLQVTGHRGPSTYLNELEYINGYIFANVWQSSLIFVIDPKTGSIVGEIDLQQLITEEKSVNPNAEVLNGIAYHPGKKTLLITGKRWQNFYELELGAFLPGTGKPDALATHQ